MPTTEELGQELERLRAKLLDVIPQGDDEEAALEFVQSDDYDNDLIKFIVLKEGSDSLAETDGALVEELLSNTELMKDMLVADGAKEGKYGVAMKIYKDICSQRTTYPTEDDDEHTDVLDRLALAIALEHAVPLAQDNPKEPGAEAEEFVDPVKRYLNYEMAYLNGELDACFTTVSTWELRFVVDGDEPDETLAWGRKTCRNFRPDHILTPNEEWRYIAMVRSEVRYGSQNVKYDKLFLQKYQNILMNGGICGRRAWFGRFILRAFGIPTTARPSRGHGALVRYTSSKGWVVVLGPPWGNGWTKTQYQQDEDFLACTQARKQSPDDYLQVKRAQWVGILLEERPWYGLKEREALIRKFGEKAAQKVPEMEVWFGLSLHVQEAILAECQKEETCEAPPEDPNHPTMAQRILATKVVPKAKKISYDNGDTIVIPSAAFDKPRTVKDVNVMKSFEDDGWQIFLKAFQPQGLTVLRGGTWKNDPDACSSGTRLLSSGYGKYPNWGFRVVFQPDNLDDSCTEPEFSFGLRDTGLSIDMIHIKPGTFVMGGENAKESRFNCPEVPKHKVELTRGFYIGKYPVTQAQYQAIMNSNPSKSTKAPDCPIDNVSEQDCVDFCREVTVLTSHELRLPTEAEWEYAARAGSETKWFFGDDPASFGDYAWFCDNADMKSHPVGQKKPNPWGLYDVYGNVCERCSDKYEKDYYAKGPRVDPSGPSAGTKSHFGYTVKIPTAGKYTLVAQVCTVNYNQRLVVSVNEAEEALVSIPFTNGEWKTSEPLSLSLEEGNNTLKFWRDQPPQYGLVVKQFTLKPE